MADPPRSPVLNPVGPTPVRELEISGPSQVLKNEGCPLCRKICTWDNKYRFWFLHENHSFPETLERLTRSLGYCFFHGAHSALDPSGQSSLTLVYNVLARRVAAILSRELSQRSTGKGSLPPFVAPDPCPTCEDRDNATGRALSPLVAKVEPAESDCRTLMKSLCFTHFRALVSRLSRRALLRTLPQYEKVLSSALDMVSEEQENVAEARLDQGSQEDNPLLMALHLAAGDDGASGLFPPLADPMPKSAIRNPVADFLDDLCADDECPVCKEMSRAWAEWMAWLADNLPDGTDLRDLLPVCPTHLQATIRLGNRFLAAESIRNALHVACNRIRQGIKLLAPPPLPDRKASSSLLNRLLFRGERPFPEIRRSIERPLPCPVCHRISVARDRSLLLLFAILESPQRHSRFEMGYGLCLRHLSRSLLLKPSERVRAILMEDMAIKLSLLQWELEESMRKDAWMFRPEAAGTERTAWIGAVRRFSGSFPECDE